MDPTIIDLLKRAFQALKGASLTYSPDGKNISFVIKFTMTSEIYHQLFEAFKKRVNRS